MTGLITNRTQADVNRVAVLRKKIAAGVATEAEQAAYLAGLRGAYNSADLNRVETAVGELQESMNDAPEGLQALAETLGVAWDSLYNMPYGEISLETRTDWAEADFPTAPEMERYLGNVKTLMQAVRLSTYGMPESMAKLTWDGANRIERALELVEAAITEYVQERETWIESASRAWYYAGDLFTGEV